jgi:carnitine 3-dehydrogenase
MNYDNTPARPEADEPGGLLLRMNVVVSAEWVDYNGHMRDFRYGEVFGEAFDALLRQVGIDAAYRDAGRMYYTVESHVKHAAEAKAGEALYITTRILGVDAKRLHVFHRLQRGSDDVQIATGEYLHLHVARAAAKAYPVDDEVRAKFETIRRAQAALPIPPETGRSIGLRQG